MKKRIGFGAVMIAVVVSLLVLDWWMAQYSVLKVGGLAVTGLPLTVVFLLLLVMSFLEMGRIASSLGVRLLPISGLLGTAMLLTLPFWWQFVIPGDARSEDLLLLLGLIVLGVFAEQMIRYRTEDALRQIALTFLTVLYLGVGGALSLQIRMAYGVRAFVLFMAAVKFTDIGAYFTGSAIGKHKLIPWLSPGKTWEGLFGGLVAAAVLSVAAVAALDIPMPLWAAAIFGPVVGAAGQFGDLSESLMKRSAQLKDSGALVPEFGGVLDILDSPLLAAPVAYILLSWTIFLRG